MGVGSRGGGGGRWRSALREECQVGLECGGEAGGREAGEVK
jgi:hypothetical protein